MQSNPVQSLLLLLVAGAAIGGWVYGLHWKRIASGESFTGEERVMIRLQDQIEVLTKKNEELNEALREIRKEEPSNSAGDLTPGDPTPEDPTAGSNPKAGDPAPGGTASEAYPRNVLPE